MTHIFSKTAPPPPSDATQILPEPEHFAMQREEDAPAGVSDQLTTQPVRRASTSSGPPTPMRS